MAMSDSGKRGTGAVTGASDVTASTMGSFDANSGRSCPDWTTSIFG
jgi:hypothetical protein